MGEKRIGEIIQNRRKELGMTLKELANRVGVSEGTISRWESGEIKNMRRDNIANLAAALNLPPTTFLDENSDENYYINKDARDLAEFLFKNPEYRVLFDASRNVKPEDIEFVKQMIDRMSGKGED